MTMVNAHGQCTGHDSEHGNRQAYGQDDSGVPIQASAWHLGPMKLTRAAAAAAAAAQATTNANAIAFAIAAASAHISKRHLLIF